MADKKNLLLLLERPGEPVFTPKGREKVVFQVPNNYLDDRYKEIGPELQTRYNDEVSEKSRFENFKFWGKIKFSDFRKKLSLARDESCKIIF